MHTCCLGTDAERQPRSSFCSSAADLKFLHRLRKTHFRNFKSKSGTRIICLLVPLLLPKFVSEGAAMYHELRKRGTGQADVVGRQRSYRGEDDAISFSVSMATWDPHPALRADPGS